MKNYNDFIKECDSGPRLNQMAGFFAETAAGRGGVPVRKPTVDMRLLSDDNLLNCFIKLHSQRQGFFDQHYHSSIPYRLEEECRMAHTLLKYSQLQTRETLLYSLGTAEATMARSLSELSGGRIRSLSCSPNEENYKCFTAFGEPSYASFFLGPFHRMTKAYLKSESRFKGFADGFDFIFEDTTFQMYSPNRLKQIEFVTQHLKRDGILLLLEKFRAADTAEYQRREYQKDFGFKTHYFGIDEIARKTKLVLNTMHDSEVTLAEMASAVYANFKYCIVTWNSGNFYGLAASNNEDNLSRYLALMDPPAIPFEYTYEPKPFTELATWVNNGGPW